jgi:monoamine oxidase
VKRSYDVIIVGAGAAGLSCAHKLLNSGSDFLLLEGRSRIGGRIFSQVEQDSNIPIELGAEFLHGTPRRTFDFFGKYEIPFYDVLDKHLMFKNSKLQKFENFWDKLSSLMAKIPRRSRKDRSVYDFIKSLKRTDPDLKSIFSSFVEGFHAADLHIMGEKALKDTEEADDHSLNGSQMFRPLLRYDLFLKRIAENVGPDRLHLKTKVEEIKWEPGNVEIKCVKGNLSPVTFHCKKLVMTVPIAVLKSDTIRWNPKPESLTNYLSYLNMGHVQKIVFHFHERFWEHLSDEPVSFLHCGPEFYFPTWWTFQPLRTPYLVAWQGGPKALELSHRSEEERVHIALSTLSKITSVPLTSIIENLQCWYTHNWSTDEYAGGAYSYISVDGTHAAESFRKSVSDTIYFAGEGTARGPARGTVHGALESGHNIL